MSFLNPIFLFALLAVAVPLLIYLLNIRKPKKIRFSTLSFFESLKSTALKRIKIKRWLLLAIRCLAIITLVLAASRPFLPPEFGWGSGNDPKVIAIIIDNSPAMDQISREGPYIEQALGLAERIIDMSGSDDRITIDVTHGAALNVPLLAGRTVRSELRDIVTRNSGNYTDIRFREMARRLTEAAEPNKMIYFLTDGRIALEDKLRELSGEDFGEVHFQMIKINGADAVNLGFDSVELESAGSGQAGLLQLRAVVRNHGNRPASNTFITLFVDDELVSQQAFNTDAGSISEFVFEMAQSEKQFIAAELLIEGDDLAFDNRYHAAIKMPDPRNLLVMHEAVAAGSNMNSYLRPMLEIAAEDESRFRVDFSPVGQVQVSDLFNYDAIVLDAIRTIPDYLAQALSDHIQNGAGLLLLPAADGNMNSYNRLLSLSGLPGYSNITGSYGSFSPIDRMAAPVEGHPILDTIFDKPDDEALRLNLPEIFYYFEIEPSDRSGDYSILNTRTGHSLLMESRAGNGRLIYSAMGSDPGWSNFAIKPFFAPLFFRTVDYLARGESASINNHYLGNQFRHLADDNLESPQLQKDGEMILPDIRQTFYGTELTYPGIEWEPGWLMMESASKEILFGVNQNTMESHLNTLDLTELVEILKESFRDVSAVGTNGDRDQFSEQLELASFGKEIWHWFVLIAIILLLLESTISRSFKAETTG